MSRVWWAALACLVLGSALAFAAGPSQMSVIVKQTQVRATPSFLGKVLDVLAYGDKVTLLDQPAGAPKSWMKISVPGKDLQGWISASALTEKEVKLQAGSENVQQSASSGEVALAGKGFNEEVEKQYKADGKLDYDWVDRMETYNPTDSQVAAFLQQGGLNTSGGAQ